MWFGFYGYLLNIYQIIHLIFSMKANIKYILANQRKNEYHQYAFFGNISELIFAAYHCDICIVSICGRNYQFLRSLGVALGIVYKN